MIVKTISCFETRIEWFNTAAVYYARRLSADWGRGWGLMVRDSEAHPCQSMEYHEVVQQGCQCQLRTVRASFTVSLWWVCLPAAISEWCLELLCMLFSYVCLLYMHIKYISNFTSTDVILTPSVLIPVFFFILFVFIYCVCIRVYVQRAEEGIKVPLLFFTLFFWVRISSWPLNLNFQLDWQPAGLSDFPVRVPNSSGVAGALVSIACFLHRFSQLFREHS